MAKNKVLTKTRGANNECSIFRRSSDNRWVGSITTGVNENGKQIKKVVYGRTRAEVSKKLLEISGRIRSNSYEMIEGQAFGELMNEWLMVFKKSAVTPRTFEGIIRNFKLFLQDDLKSKKEILEDFKEVVLPWWEKEVEQYVVGGKAKPFNIILKVKIMRKLKNFAVN